MQSTVLGIILGIFGVYALINRQYIPGLFFLGLSFPFYFIRKYSDFDPEKKTLFIYYSFLGIPIGSKTKIEKIKGIKIAKVSSRQRVNSRVSSMDINDSGYGAILFYDDEKFNLKFDKDKNALFQEMNSLCETHSIKLKV